MSGMVYLSLGIYDNLPEKKIEKYQPLKAIEE